MKFLLFIIRVKREELLFIIRVNRELKRVYRHGCRNCRSGQTLKKPKYLSACDREERGRHVDVGRVIGLTAEERLSRGSPKTGKEKKNFVYYESMKRNLI